jgi:hypothetical protein
MKTLHAKLSQLPDDFRYRLALTKHAKSLPNLPPSDQQIVDALHTDGVFVTSFEQLGFNATPKLLEAIQDLMSELELASTVQGEQRRVNTSYAIQPRPGRFVNLTDYPAFFLWGLEDRLLQVVEHYIGLPVAYHGLLFRQDEAVDKPGATQRWHRDGEDRRVVKVLIYLNDVGLENGPFEYIPRSSTPSLLSFGKIYQKILSSGYSNIDDDEMRQIISDSAWKACTGPAGTVIFADVRNVFHRGNPPRGNRSVLYYLYTSRQPKRPDICKANFGFSKEKLAEISSTTALSQQQKNCVFWEQEIS